MKSYRPTSPSRRQTSTVPYRTLLTRTEPEKSLTYGRKRAVGRNSQGRLTTRHKGGGHKRLFREIDFAYDKREISARLESVEYDPNRTGFIGLVTYQDGAKRYVLLPQSVTVGERFLISPNAEVKPGNRLPLKKIPVGAFVYNIELHPGGGAKLVRSAGSFAQVLSNDAGYTQIKLPSTEVRKINENAWASIGSVSNPEQKLANLGKAGRSRWLGIRPTVRGSVMNPVDHPHGGGEAKAGQGNPHPVTPWGVPTKGYKTRHNKRTQQFIVRDRGS